MHVVRHDDRRAHTQPNSSSPSRRGPGRRLGGRTGETYPARPAAGPSTRQGLPPRRDRCCGLGRAETGPSPAISAPECWRIWYGFAASGQFPHEKRLPIVLSQHFHSSAGPVLEARTTPGYRDANRPETALAATTPTPGMNATSHGGCAEHDCMATLLTESVPAEHSSGLGMIWQPGAR